MKRLIAGALLAGTAMSAQAADLPARMYTKAPVLATVYDWTGFYIGVNAGGGVGRDRTINSIPVNLVGNTFFQQPSGVIGGGQIGYNWQTNMSFLGPVLFGVEADIQGADMRDSNSFTGGILTSTFTDRLDWFGTVRGRVGLVTGSTVGYVTGGYAYGNVRTSVTGNFGAAAPLTGTVATSQMRDGYALGSGVEAALGGNWTGKIEYLYVNLGNRTDAFTLVGFPQTVNTQFRENIFRAGLNYRIGGTPLNPTPANWTGFYLGGNVGTGLSSDRTSFVGSVAGIAPSNSNFKLARDGYNYGGQLGYNWQAASWVFGVEGDFQGTTERDRTTCVSSCTPVNSSSYNSRLPWFATARGRLGYSVGSTLFYATGGYAVGEVKTGVRTVFGGGAPVATALSTTKSGYAVGGGIETPFQLFGLFGPNWTTKTEYLYVDLGSVTSSFVPLAGNTPFTLTQRVQEHIFRTGLNYHFNSPVVARY